jgi:pimeloyl-ACP methyl ester carboxylesterase
MPTHGNKSLESLIVENGGANIVFLNGFRIQFKTWDKVYPELTSDNSVILFNRRGVGSSLKAKEAQDGSTVIEEMHSLFANSQLNPPFILVAHSLGGFFANLYARVYPSEVAGVVFVDAPHPLEVAEQKSFRPPFVLNMLFNGLKSAEKLFDKFRYSEDESIDETINQINSAAHFPNVPVAVVSGAKKMPFVPVKAFEVHQEYKAKLLGLSSKSSQYLCRESGHFPQITEPQKVIAAIRKTVEEAKIT